MNNQLHSQRSKVTIKDIARQSGVSTQTVSRVLNDRPDVSPETRQRVQAVIERTGYHPSALARSLIRRRSYTLGVIIAGLKYAGVSQTLNGIADQAETSGYSLLLKELPAFDLPDVQPVIQSLLAHDVEGIIYAAPEYGDNLKTIQAKLSDPCPPLVFLKSQPHPLYATISIDNYSGGLKATNHLIDMGCRKIAHISGPLEWWEARQRKLGWEDALVATGMEVNELHWSSGNWSSTSGEGAFLDLLEKCPQMDGLFAGNDQMALGALHAAHQRGIVIPRDLAVVGFDDLPEAAYFNPSLTTVRQELRQLGILAVKKVLQTICAEVPGTQAEELPDTLILQPELIIRDSSRRLQGSI